MTITRSSSDDAVIDRTFALEGGLSASLAVALAAVVVIEGAVLHLWVASRSLAWAWSITGINLVTLVWLWGEVRSASRSALRVGERDVDVVVGNRVRCRFARRSIASADRATWRSVPDLPPSDYLNAAKPLEPNVMLVLRVPVLARLPLGVTKPVTRIGLRVGDPDAVIAALAEGSQSSRERALGSGRAGES